MKPYYEHAGITIYHGDCREVLPGLSDGWLVTDPPYGTGGRRRGSAGQGSDPAGRLVREGWDTGEVEWVDGRMPCAAFYPAGRTLALLGRAAAVGLTKHRAVYLHKPDPSPQFGGRMAYSVEPVWVLTRDGFTLTGGTDWYEASAPRANRDNDATGHPYQKPAAFMEWLISKLPDATLTDPFMGSGTTLVAAKNLGRKAIGIEIEERYCEIAAKRLAQEVLL